MFAAMASTYAAMASSRRARRVVAGPRLRVPRVLGPGSREVSRAPGAGGHGRFVAGRRLGALEHVRPVQAVVPRRRQTRARARVHRDVRDAPRGRLGPLRRRGGAGQRAPDQRPVARGGAHLRAEPREPTEVLAAQPRGDAGHGGEFGELLRVAGARGRGARHQAQRPRAVRGAVPAAEWEPLRPSRRPSPGGAARGAAATSAASLGRSSPSEYPRGTPRRGRDPAPTAAPRQKTATPDDDQNAGTAPRTSAPSSRRTTSASRCCGRTYSTKRERFSKTRSASPCRWEETIASR